MKEASDGKTEGRFGVYVKFWARKDIASEIGQKTFLKTSPLSGTRLPTLVLEIVESRAIARLKAKSEENAFERTVWPYLPGFRGENARA